MSLFRGFLQSSFGKECDSKERFISYWHQIDEIVSLHLKKILEIGIGNSFVARYLGGQGIDMTTCDLNSDLDPDVCGSVLALPFMRRTFDTVACFEVLEHLPLTRL